MKTGAVTGRARDGEVAASDPEAAGGQEERPILPTMNREKPYPLGMSRAELDRRRQRSLTETSEFAFAPSPDEKPAHLEDGTTTRDEDHEPSRKLLESVGRRPDLEEVRRPPKQQLNYPFMIQVSHRITPPLPSEGMGLIVYQPDQDTSRNLNDPNMNEGVHSLPNAESAVSDYTQPASQQLLFNDPFMSRTTAGGMISPPIAGPSDDILDLAEPESGAESYSDVFTHHTTLHSSPGIQTPNEGDREDDSSSVDSDGYPYNASDSGYRRRSSVGVGPQEESHLLREWRVKKREELEVKSRKSEESRHKISDAAQAHMKLFYAKRSAELETRKKINREKERVFNAVHNIGKDPKMPLNLWEVVVSMLPPAPTAERSKSSGNRTPAKTPATPQKLMSPSIFFSQQIPIAPQATQPKQGTAEPKRGNDVNKKDMNTITTRDEIENIPPVEVTDISRMRQILIKLKDKPPYILEKETEFP